MATAPPRSVLFLSADLIGSTQYKQKVPGWQSIFLSFYRDFPKSLGEQLSASPPGMIDQKFTLWKAIGDELIFEVTVSHENEVSDAIRVWLNAVKIYEEQTLSDKGLTLKSGAFIATFPGPDSESTIPRTPEIERSEEDVIHRNDTALAGEPRDHKNYHYDYFGPSIDTGFRILEKATHRYFPITVEVAWALAVAAHTEQAENPRAPYHSVDDLVFSGVHEFKGVWGGREYPLFAIDREIANPIHTAIAGLNTEALSAKNIIEVSAACNDSDDWPGALYLPNSQHKPFTQCPEDAMASLRKIAGSLDAVESLLETDLGETVALPSGSPLE